MKDKWNFSGRFANSDLMHYLRFAVIPLAAVILIAVIMRVDKGKDVSGAEGEGAQTVLAGDATDAWENPDGGTLLSENENSADDGAALPDGGSESGVAAIGEGAPGDDTDSEETESVKESAPGQAYADIDISQYTLKRDEVPELLALVRTYCQAKEDCDPELLARLFGRSGLTDEEIAAEKERMELVKASIKRYENISCYSIEGPEPDSYVVFPYFELRYREAETLMPQLTWVYVTKLEDGSFVMNEEVSEDVAAYIARIGEREDVTALRMQVADAMAEAVSSDEKLKSIYSGESEVVIGD